MSNFFRKIGKVFKSIGKFLHKLWLKKKPVILSMIKGALYAFKPVLAKKIEEKKDDFKPDEIADFIIGYAITKMNVLLSTVAHSLQILSIIPEKVALT